MTRGDAGRGTPEASEDAKVAALLERLDSLEERLDPRPTRRARLLADVMTAAVLMPIALYLDWHATRPLLLLSLMGIGIGANHLVPFLWTHSLRRRRDRLLAELDEVTSGRPQVGR